MKFTFRDVTLWVVSCIALQVAGNVFRGKGIPLNEAKPLHIMGIALLLSVGLFFIALGAKAVVSIVGKEKQMDIVISSRFVFATVLLISVIIIIFMTPWTG